MAIDIEAIGISFDTASVNTGAKALDNLGKEADSASKKVDSLGTTSQTVAQKIKAQNAEIATSTIEMRKNAESVEVTSSSISKLINKYDPLSSQLKKVQADFKALDDAASKGQIGADDLSRVDTAYANMQKELQALTSATGAYGNEAEKAMGKSMFATAGARRELIVMGHEAIQGNFSRMPGSLMVLAERTGVSAAGFGVMAAAGLGVAAVLGTVAYAAIEGAKELTEMNRAIGMTSNFAGQTTSSMQSLAREIANTSTLTMGQSKQVVMELAASGKIGAESFTMISNVVAEYSRVTGKAADDSTKDIIKLFSDPKKGAEELNSTMHFLSASEMERIDTLQRTGHVVEAQLLLADKLKSKLDSEVEPLGILAKSWDAVKKASSSAWDSMMAIGRPDSAQEKIDGIKAHIKQLELQKSPLGAFGSGGSSALIGDYGVEIDKLKLQLQSAEFDLVKKSTEAKKQAADAAKVDNDNELAALRNNNSELFKHQKIREEIARLQAAQVGLSGQDAKINQDAIKQLELQLVNKKAVAAENKREKEALKELQKEVLADEAEKQALRAEEQKAKQAYIKLIDEEQAKVEALSFSEITALDKQISAIKLKNSEIGKTPEQISLVKAAVEDASIAQLQLEADTLRSAAEYVDMSDQFKAIYIDRANALDIEIAKRKEISGLLSDQAILEQNAAAAKKAAEDWKKTSNEINRSLTDALLRGFESGKSFAQNFKDTLINMFKTLILRPIIKAVVDMSGVGGMTATMFGGGTNNPLGSASGTSGMGGIFDSVKNIFSMIQNGNASIVSGIEQVGAYISNGLGGIQDTIGGFIGKNASSIADGFAYAGAIIALSQGKFATAAGTAIGTYFLGPIGGAIGGYLGGLLDSALSGKVDPSGNTSGTYKDGQRTSRTDFSGWNDPVTPGIVNGLAAIQDAFAGSLNALLVAFNKNADISLTGSARAGDIFQGSISGTAGGKGVGVNGWEGQAADLQSFAELALGKALASSIQNLDLSANIKSLFADLTDSKSVNNMLNATINLVHAEKVLNDSFGMTVDQAAAVAKATGLTGDALSTFITQLISSAGGMTAAQTLVAARGTLTTLLGGSLPDTLAGFDEIIKAIDKSNAAGIAKVAALLNVRAGFEQYTAAIDGLKGGVKSSVFSLSTPQDQLASMQKDLAAMFDSLGLAVPKSKEELIALGNSIDFTTEAGIKLSIAFPALVTAFNQTSNAAATAAAALAQAAASIASEHYGLQTQLLQLQGNTTEIRKRELLLLDEKNRGIQQEIWDLQDKQAAETQAAAASQAAAAQAQQAADAIRSAWQSVTDSIFAEVNRIRGLMNGGGASSLASAQADFMIATAQARAGDQNAAKLLPQLSQTLLTLAMANASTLTELRRIQGAVANSLNTTGTQLATSQGLTIPSFAVGSDYIPNDMHAQIHQGERITPAAYNRSDATNAELLTEIKGLRTDNQNLRADNQEMAKDMKKLKEVMVNVTQGGYAIQTQVAV